VRGPDEVAIFVTRRRRAEILVVHRSPELGGYWHTIAGAVEAGETFAEAAARELQEETGLATPVHATGDFHYPLAEEPPERRKLYEPGVTAVHVHCFVTDAPDGWEPTLDDEHVEYRWDAAADAPAALFYPDIADALRQALA
jgi:lipoyl(octanoyl) transferase